MTTKLRSITTHPAAAGRVNVLIGALTALIPIAEPPEPIAGPPPPTTTPKRNSKHRYAPDPMPAPPQVYGMGRLLGASGALEVFYFRGAADLITDKYALALDPGCWLVARFPRDHEPMDGTVAAFTKQAEDKWRDEP